MFHMPPVFVIVALLEVEHLMEGGVYGSNFFYTEHEHAFPSARPSAWRVVLMLSSVWLNLKFVVL